MFYTSIEQSKKLVELGLDSNKADMYYIVHRDIMNPKEYASSQFPHISSKKQKPIQPHLKLSMI